jgi:hypothetical protein
MAPSVVVTSSTTKAVPNRNSASGIEMLMVQPLEVMVLAFPLVDGVPCLHSTLLWIFLKFVRNLLKGLNQNITKFERISM